MNAKMKKTGAARYSRGDPEHENASRGAGNEDPSNEKTRRERLKERRVDLKRKQGQILTEAEVRRRGYNRFYRAVLELILCSYGPRETPIRTLPRDGMASRVACSQAQWGE